MINMSYNMETNPETGDAIHTVVYSDYTNVRVRTIIPEFVKSPLEMTKYHAVFISQIADPEESTITI